MAQIIKDFSLPVYSNDIPKYINLWNKYKDVFIKKNTKNIMFFEGLYEIGEYIESSFYFLVNSNYKDRNNIEKIIIAIYCKVKHDDFIKTEIKDLAEKSLLMSLGLEEGLKSYIWDKDSINYSNLIKHTIKKVFLPELLKFFKSKIIELSNIENEENSIEDFENEIIKIDFISKKVKDKLIQYLEGKIDIEFLTELDKNILEMVYKKNF